MIIHVDMDAFYASVEERDRPEIKGKPVAVGGTPEGRGVVAAANYKAREFGIHSAMPMARAKRLCKDLIILPARHDHYAEVSREIRAIFHRFTPLVEPLALDEAFLDVTASRRLFGTAPAIGRRIKQEIRSELKLTASVGVGPNKYVAKVASDLKKPDGLVVVDPQNVQPFLDPLPVSRLWGVGKVADGRLAEYGIRTIGQLRMMQPDFLEKLFGNWGEQLWKLSQGIDERPVVPDHEAKSISHETTFPEDLTDRIVLMEKLMELTDQVARRLRRNGLSGRTVQVKIRFTDFRTMTRSRKLKRPSHTTRDLWKTAAGLLNSNLPKTHPGIRLIGMGVQDLSSGLPHQRDLFDQAGDDRQKKIDEASDRIRDRFGDSILRRGA